MLINGIDRKFKLTVGAAMDIAEMCPDRNISKIKTILAGNDTVAQMGNIAKVAVIMNKWAEKSMPEKDRSPELTLDDVLSLDFTSFKALSDAIMDSFSEGQETKVKAKPIEGKKKDEQNDKS